MYLLSYTLVKVKKSKTYCSSPQLQYHGHLHVITRDSNYRNAEITETVTFVKCRDFAVFFAKMP